MDDCVQRRIEFIVATDGPVTWWKALRLLNIFDEVVISVEVEGTGQWSPPIHGLYDEIWWGDLVFAKAKLFGKHEDKYDYSLSPRHLAAIGAGPGKRVVFIWSADSLPRPPGC